MPISSRDLIRSTSSFLLIGFVALMAIVAMNFWLDERARFYSEDAISARDTRFAAVELRNSMLAAESSQRGFIITGNEIYLAPYQSAKAQAQRQLAALQRLLPSYFDAEATLKRLSEILAAKFEEFDRTIALKRDQRDEAIRSIFRTNNGKALTDEANVFFAGIIGRADDRMTSGVAEQRANAGWLRIVSAIGALVIVAVISGAAIVLTRYTNDLRATRDQLNALNSELEQRVARRTADLAKARDRAEILLSEVNHRVANSLALVSSMVNLQSRTLDDEGAKYALAETQDRIFAISLVHKQLYTSGDVRTVELKAYLSALLANLRSSLRSDGHGVNLSFEIDVIDLETDASVNLGVVITELVTNAFKYAYPDRAGEIRVRLRRLMSDVELVVEDDGVGMPEGVPAIGTGAGARIINAMCASLRSRITYRRRNPGTAACLVFPANLPRPAAV
jgi:two-component sensor histidine kinase/CHASE3 domain sensor protein